MKQVSTFLGQKSAKSPLIQNDSQLCSGKVVHVKINRLTSAKNQPIVVVGGKIFMKGMMHTIVHIMD